MSPLLKNIGLAFILALIAFLGYVMFLKEDEMPLTAELGDSDAIRQGQEFLMRIRQLDQITLEGDVLRDQRFTSLVDFTIEPEEEEVGRDNPFEPLPGTTD